jgi:multicomponent Na+:H+ antiporter subunit C
MNVQLDTLLLVGLMAGVATYLVLSRSFVRILFGFVVLSNAANLAILAVSGDPSGRTAPVVGDALSRPMVDPLPQALILTAIVIGFGVLAYLLFLFYRMFVDHDTVDLEELHARDEAAVRAHDARTGGVAGSAGKEDGS